MIWLGSCARMDFLFRQDNKNSIPLFSILFPADQDVCHAARGEEHENDAADNQEDAFAGGGGIGSSGSGHGEGVGERGGGQLDGEGVFAGLKGFQIRRRKRQLDAAPLHGVIGVEGQLCAVHGNLLELVKRLAVVAGGVFNHHRQAVRAALRPFEQAVGGGELIIVGTERDMFIAGFRLGMKLMIDVMKDD